MTKLDRGEEEVKEEEEERLDQAPCRSWLSRLLFINPLVLRPK